MVAAAVMLGACENAEQDFPDFKYNATYFPYQYPSRVLILGEDEQINTAPDNRGEFKIGCTMGGVYANDRSRDVEYVIDESLVENLYTSSGVELKALPRSYYNYHEGGTMVIPKGSMQGYLDIKLTDEFFEDADSKNLKYVIPGAHRKGADGFCPAWRPGSSECRPPNRYGLVCKADGFHDLWDQVYQCLAR